MEFTMWDEDDIRIFLCTEKTEAVGDLLRLFDFPWRRKWAVPWIDEAAAVQYAHQYVKLSQREEIVAEELAQAKNGGKELAQAGLTPAAKKVKRKNKKISGVPAATSIRQTMELRHEPMGRSC